MCSFIASLKDEMATNIDLYCETMKCLKYLVEATAAFAISTEPKCDISQILEVQGVKASISGRATKEIFQKNQQTIDPKCELIYTKHEEVKESPSPVITTINLVQQNQQISIINKSLTTIIDLSQNKFLFFNRNIDFIARPKVQNPLFIPIKSISNLIEKFQEFNQIHHQPEPKNEISIIFRINIVALYVFVCHFLPRLLKARKQKKIQKRLNQQRKTLKPCKSLSILLKTKPTLDNLLPCLFTWDTLNLVEINEHLLNGFNLKDVSKRWTIIKQASISNEFFQIKPIKKINFKNQINETIETESIVNILLPNTQSPAIREQIYQSTQPFNVSFPQLAICFSETQGFNFNLTQEDLAATQVFHVPSEDTNLAENQICEILETNEDQVCLNFVEDQNLTKKEIRDTNKELVINEEPRERLENMKYMNFIPIYNQIFGNFKDQLVPQSQVSQRPQVSQTNQTQHDEIQMTSTQTAFKKMPKRRAFMKLGLSKTQNIKKRLHDKF